MQWTVAEARKRFAGLLDMATREPQQILNRRKPVATVIGIEASIGFEKWKAEEDSRTLAESFQELRSICAGAGYTMAWPKRRNRENTFARRLDERPGRHEHPR